MLGRGIPAAWRLFFSWFNWEGFNMDVRFIPGMAIMSGPRRSGFMRAPDRAPVSRAAADGDMGGMGGGN